MLFAIDVGNTNITMGLFDRKKLEKTFRMTTGISRTSDEFGVFLGELLRMRNLPLDVIDEVIIASVVPNVMHSLTNGIRKYFKLDPLIVEPGVKTGINIVLVVIGVVLGALVGYLCNILFFAVDFRRTEYVQYEDDEYYYYVKAVPKINVAGEDVRVKQINARKTKKASDISDVRQAKSTTAATEEDDEMLYFDK